EEDAFTTTPTDEEADSKSACIL